MTKADKKSFILYCDQLEMLKKLTDKQAGFLIKQIYGYCGNGRKNPNISDPIVDMAFTSMKISLDRDYEKYLNIVERNKKNGKLGGRPNKPK